MTIDKPTLALPSIVGSALDLPGALYLACDLLCGNLDHAHERSHPTGFSLDPLVQTVAVGVPSFCCWTPIS